MCEKFAFNFNMLRDKKEKCYYLLASFSICLFSVLNTYLNPKLQVNPLLPKGIILVYTFMFTLFPSLFEGTILAIIVRAAFRKVNFKNVFIGLCTITILFESLFDIVRLCMIANENVFMMCCISLLFIYFKFIFYYFSLKMSFKDLNRKSIYIGLLVILIFNFPISIFM